MPRLGSGDIQFKTCLLDPGIAICVCSHPPAHQPNRDEVIAQALRAGVDLTNDFSLLLDATGEQDVLLIFGNAHTLRSFASTLLAAVPTEPATVEKVATHRWHTGHHGKCLRCDLPVQQWTNDPCPAAPVPVAEPQKFGDGHYCTHHPDDPAHTADCYDAEKHFAQPRVCGEVEDTDLGK